jgi:TonB family protein
MSAWKALYVIPLVGISLAATAETRVDYQYEDQQPEAVADTLEGKDSKNSLPEPESEFTKKNLREGRFIVDKENNTFTLHYFDAECKELQVHYTGLDLNQNIYMHNGAVVTQDMMMKAAKDDSDAVIIVAYLKGENRVSAAITKTGPYITGTINTIEQQDGFTLKSSIHLRTADDKEADIDMNDPVLVVNGERMPEGFDLNTIDPKTITSIEVLKTEKALQEYETDKGVIVITTGEPKKNEDRKVVPFQLAAQKPGFNGGDANEFSKYVAQNVVYPESCRQSRIEGRVTLEFTVTETGKVADIKILRSVNGDLDREAVRVVAQSPLWTPGRDENGEVVPVKYTFPVIFKLPDSENK